MDERFGPFRLVSRLGRGGMAETFVGERTGPAGFVLRVCVKRMLPHVGNDPGWVRSFQSEARLVGMLHHPNIVSVHDIGEERGTWWMCLELVEGRDLRTLLGSLRARDERLPLDVVVHIAIELAKGLEYAHTRRLPSGAPAEIVHRDVSPANVLLSYDGGVKLADFGIAKIADGDRTRTGLRKGKARYMSPEQALGDRIDARTDLFALGIVMYEMIAGTRPFDGKTDLATQKNIVEAIRRPLAELAPTTPPALVAIVERLLEPIPAHRFASADALIDALAPFAPGPTVARALGAKLREVVPAHEIPSDGALTEVEDRRR